jgi:CheY-like chemotaxis protein
VRFVSALAARRDDQRCRVLIVEDDAVAAESVAQKLAGENLDVSRVARAREALDALRKRRFDCIILDLSLPDMDGLALLQSIEKECGHDMPAAVVYASRALSKAESIKLESYAAAVVLREGSSAERLRDEVRLFARRLKEGLATRRRAAAPLHPADMHMEGRKVLVVDDDMRTVYALSATLRAKGIDVLVADTGRAALSVLAERTDVEAVLMDIMMPEMDGYEATRRIRDQARYRDLPIIALTAKAMKDDREKCLEAGATDYLPKPIDPDRLLAVLHSNLNGRGAHAT